MKRYTPYLSAMALLMMTGSIQAQDYFDDVYYNPKVETKASTQVNTPKQKKSNYIADFGEMDVDAYNRRGGQYYVSEIDTIGSTVENAEDFVYTQQIQKYYNPTIVVDNANALGDVLSNAYGNVEIVINDNGIPVFAPWYGYSWPYYSSVWSPWSWGINIGPWGWNVGFYDPWYSWNWGWGPSWGWGPGWGPGWGGPAWGPPPGPGWGPGWRPGPMAVWNPRANRPVGPRPGWNAPNPPRNPMAMNKPPVGNYRGNPGNYGGSTRPSGMQGTSRPSGVVNNDGRWQYNTSGNSGHRVSGTGALPGNNPSVTVNKSGNSTARPTPSVTNNRNNNSGNRPAVSTGNNNRSSYGSGNRSTSGGSRSVGGGGRSTGGRSGGGGGRHR